MTIDEVPGLTTIKRPLSRFRPAFS
jgi:hypothetical protein